MSQCHPKATLSWPEGRPPGGGGGDVGELDTELLMAKAGAAFLVQWRKNLQFSLTISMQICRNFDCQILAVKFIHSYSNYNLCIQILTVIYSTLRF